MTIRFGGVVRCLAENLIPSFNGYGSPLFQLPQENRASQTLQTTQTDEQTAFTREMKGENTSTTTYTQQQTALLIVDPYNDFMSEGGKLYAATKETANAVGFYENMRKLIPAVRAVGIQVFIVPHHRSH